jgi:hypothetical protein
MRKPDFDIDLKIGAQSELWVEDICEMLAERNGTVEVKAPKPFLREQSFYVEYECRGRDGKWRPSGISTTKAKAFAFTFGCLPGAVIIETEWLTRAARLAFKKGFKRECSRGSNPTRAVVVSLHELWETRGREP